MKAEKFIKIREGAGLSLDQISQIIRTTTRTIRRYEDGSIPISGPVSVLMILIAKGILYEPV